MSTTIGQRVTCVELGGFRWWMRPDVPSDLSAIREVAERRAYFTRYFTPEAGERWLDAGAYIGAFSVVCAALGAEVTAYEPTPESADLARRNVTENDLTARIINKAVALEGGVARLGLSRSPWRNSLLRHSGDGHAVPVVPFDVAVHGMDGAKLDIEGAEIAILQQADLTTLSKLVFEWHFDHERRTDVYLDVLERLRGIFPNVRGRVVKPNELYNYYPPAALVRCWHD